MLSFSGAAYQSGMMPASSANLVKATVGSRSALTCNAANGSHVGYWQLNQQYTAGGAVGTSTDTGARALAVDAWVAFSALSLGAGAYSDVLTWYTSDAATQHGQTRTAILSAHYSGSAYSLVLRTKLGTQTAYDTASLGTVAADSAYHTVSLWQFRDKIYYQFDGGAVGSLTYTATQTATVWPNFPTMTWAPTVCVAAWDALRMAVEEYPLSATAGTSVCNGHNDDGALYLIEKTALAGLVTAGTAYELAITAGAFTESATADKDYLCCKVGSDNNAGYGVKLNKSAGGAWTKSLWSLT